MRNGLGFFVLFNQTINGIMLYNELKKIQSIPLPDSITVPGIGTKVHHGTSNIIKFNVKTLIVWKKNESLELF
jgi:hypothetical protein